MDPSNAHRLRRAAGRELGSDDDEDDEEVRPTEFASHGSDFDVESSDVGWRDVLRGLRDEGEIEMMNRLVDEYGLQDHLASLDDDNDDADDDNDDADTKANHALRTPSTWTGRRGTKRSRNR